LGEDGFYSNPKPVVHVHYALSEKPLPYKNSGFMIFDSQYNPPNFFAKEIKKLADPLSAIYAPFDLLYAPRLELLFIAWSAIAEFAQAPRMIPRNPYE